jgi:hypothetical protein
MIGSFGEMCRRILIAIDGRDQDVLDLTTSSEDPPDWPHP